MSAVESIAVLHALPDWALQANQSVTYPRMFASVAESHGLPQTQLLANAGLPGDLLDNPAGKVSLQAIWKIIDALITHTADPALTFEVGLRMPLTAHGTLGYALMCAGTPRQALGILARYWHLRGRGLQLRVEIDQGSLFLEVTPEIVLPQPLRDAQMSAILTSMYCAMQFMMPTLATTDEIWLQGEPPPNLSRWQRQLPTVRFGMPRAGIALRGDTQVLDHPLPTANPEALAQALAQCERESALLGDDQDLVRRLRAALTVEAEGYPTPAMLAQQLHLSPRTLRRRLQDQGYNYQQLLEQARRRDSLTLLSRPELEIRRVAELLGYADPANFTRAFRQWTGMTPSAWKARLNTLHTGVTPGQTL